MKRRNRLLRAGAACIAVAITLAACTGVVEDTNGETDTDTSLIIARATGSTHFQTDAGGLSGVVEIVMQLHGTLLRNPYVESSRDANAQEQNIYEFEGYLAERYEVDDDGLVYTFHLRPDVVSHAGNPLTADDVLWTAEAKFNTPTSITPFVSAPAITDPSTQFEKIDDLTFSVTLERAGDGFTLLSLLSSWLWFIYDSELLLENASDEDPYGIQWSRDIGNYGFGPYQLDSFVPDGEVVISRNPNFFGEQPAISQVTYRAVPDSGNRAAALLSGDVDIAMALRPSEQVSLIESSDDIAVFDVESNLFAMMSLVTNQAPFDELAVRQAMAYAIPYDELQEEVYLDRSYQPNGLLNPNAPGYTEEGLPSFSYDPARALEILGEAGVATPVPFTLSVSSAVPDLEEVAIRVAAAAAEAGFDIDINLMPAEGFTQARNAGELQSFLLRDYSIVLTPSYQLLLYTGAGSSNNLAQWEDPLFYDLVDEAIEVGDALTEEAGVAYGAAEAYLLEQAPFLLLQSVQPGIAMSSSLDGYAFRTDSTVEIKSLSWAE